MGRQEAPRLVVRDGGRPERELWEKGSKERVQDPSETAARRLCSEEDNPGIDPQVGKDIVQSFLRSEDIRGRKHEEAVERPVQLDGWAAASMTWTLLHW